MTVVDDESCSSGSEQRAMSGAKLAEEGHFPFGELWYQTSGNNKWFFTTYDRDSEDGLDYALARYYNSRTGTFCSADPLAGSPGDPQSWNRYPYGRNDPIDITDPSGKSWLSLIIDIGIGAAVALLPEFAPTLFEGSSVVADESALSVTTDNGAVIGIHMGESLTVAAGGMNWGAAIPGALAGGLGGSPLTGGNPTPNPYKDWPQFKKAKDLAKQKPCKDWYTGLITKAFEQQKGGPLNPEETAEVQREVNNIPTVLDNTPTTLQSTEDPTLAEGFRTNAEVNGDFNKLTLYRGFTAQEFLGAQEQILVHEAIHLATHLLDQWLAQAVDGKHQYPITDAGRAAASVKWHGELTKHCK